MPTKLDLTENNRKDRQNYDIYVTIIWHRIRSSRSFFSVSDTGHVAVNIFEDILECNSHTHLEKSA
jgi:hypothetical protein